jgi:Na+/H+-dicarboxylate symporter
MSLSRQILIGLVAGVAVGPFFGETVAPQFQKDVASGFSRTWDVRLKADTTSL